MNDTNLFSDMFRKKKMYENEKDFCTIDKAGGDNTNQNGYRKVIIVTIYLGQISLYESKLRIERTVFEIWAIICELYTGFWQLFFQLISK